MGYTHIEIMPVTEFPFEGSWGYQCTGYFSVTSRLGSPADFMYFIDTAHQHGIGIILDWVPSHFPKDDFGICEFDGEPLYEHPRWDRIEHKTWGTRRFDYGRTEIQSFLVSSAMLFLDYYHIDGLRVDAVASMLYLDYDKSHGEWIPNDFGENKNLEAVAFIQKLNTAIFREYPHAMMIAEESTAWTGVTKPVSHDGLGFNFKWNMGWMNDVTEYVCVDPWFRRDHHNKITFSMMYAFTENFVLPISHDEVVYGKGSLINKMFGNYDQKFDGLRTFLAYMYAHPGKKLLFMGSEIAQFDEWNHNTGLQFNLLFYDKHYKTQSYVRDLNKFYSQNSPLFQLDFGWEGFKWLTVDDRDANTLAFVRRDRDKNEIICVFNFSCAERKNYKLNVASGMYMEIFSTAREQYGGHDYHNGKMRTKTTGDKTILSINLAPQSAIFIKKTLNTCTI
jgi:1,4-alpha-glucan branching enzyme